MEESRLKVEVWQLRDRILQQASQIEDLKAQLKHTRRSSDKFSKRKRNECRIRRAKLDHCQFRVREAREENERLKAKLVVYQRRRIWSSAFTDFVKRWSKRTRKYTTEARGETNKRR